jgi:hypothetical protein
MFLRLKGYNGQHFGGGRNGKKSEFQKKSRNFKKSRNSRKSRNLKKEVGISKIGMKIK